MDIFLPAKQPFRFDLAMQYLQRSDQEILDVVHGDGSYRRVLEGPSGPALVEVSAADGGVTARLLSGTIPEEILAARVRHQFQLDQDRSNLPLDEPFARPLVENFAGLPVVQTGSPFEAMVWAILGQQINIGFAYRLKRRFVENYGDRIVHDGQIYYRFPVPERIVTIDPDELREIQFSRQKTRYIQALAQSVLDGEIDFAAIEQLDDEEALLALQRQVGIGRWTAEYALMRSMGRRDVIPAGDMGLRSAIGVFRNIKGNASEAEVRQIAEHWKPYRGNIGFLCWFGFQHGFYRRGSDKPSS